MKLIMLLLLVSTNAYAGAGSFDGSFDGSVEKVDSKTVKITRSQESVYDIADLKAKRDYLISERAQALNGFDVRISDLDARIQEAKVLGVE